MSASRMLMHTFLRISPRALLSRRHTTVSNGHSRDYRQDLWLTRDHRKMCHRLVNIYQILISVKRLCYDKGEDAQTTHALTTRNHAGANLSNVAAWVILHS